MVSDVILKDFMVGLRAPKGVSFIPAVEIGV